MSETITRILFFIFRPGVHRLQDRSPRAPNQLMAAASEHRKRYIWHFYFASLVFIIVSVLLRLYKSELDISISTKEMCITIYPAISIFAVQICYANKFLLYSY